MESPGQIWMSGEPVSVDLRSALAVEALHVEDTAARGATEAPLCDPAGAVDVAHLAQAVASLLRAGFPVVEDGGAFLLENLCQLTG